MTYKVLFGQNRENSKSDILFKSIFPTIHNFIKLYKSENNDYRVLAYELQRAESDLIFNNIIKEISEKNSDIRIITVHDSIIVQRRWKDFVSKIFNEKITQCFQVEDELARV